MVIFLNWARTFLTNFLTGLYSGPVILGSPSRMRDAKMSQSAICRRSAVAFALVAALSASACSQTFEDDLLGAGPEYSAAAATQAVARSRAKAYFRVANYAQAERSFRAAIAKNGKDGEAWLGLAATCDRLGHFPEADQAYARVLELAGRRAEVVNNMAWSQLLRGNRDVAKTLFAEAVKLAPRNPVIASNAATVDKPFLARS
jgi:Flp pilus assembly protein TadD